MTSIHVCPLCKSTGICKTAVVPVEPVLEYWRSIGVDARLYGVPDQGHFDKVECLECSLVWFDPAVTGDGDLYAALSRQPWYYSPFKWENLAVLKFLHQAGIGSFLELGSGKGHFLEKVAAKIPETFGIEFNPEGVKACREKGLNVDSRSLEDIDRTFQCVSAFQVLEHVPDPGNILKKMLERVETGGYIILSVPNDSGFLGELERNFLNQPPHHVTLWSSDAFANIAGLFGLELVDHQFEPLGFAGYLSLVDERTARLFRSGWKGKLTNSLISTMARVGALKGYASEGRTMKGHTQLAIFRKI